MTSQPKQESKCPSCGSKNLGMGKFTQYARLIPVDGFSFGSDVYVELCRDCGHVVGMKVKKPERF